MKPNGLRFDMTPGGPALRVNAPTRTEDAIWEAVTAAIECGMSPREFRVEAAEAWAHEMDEQKAAARRDLEGS